jgi:hypothetical protein
MNENAMFLMTRIIVGQVEEGIFHQMTATGVISVAVAVVAAEIAAL